MALLILDSHGWATHRVERAANGVDLVVVDKSRGAVVDRIKNGAISGGSIEVSGHKVCWA